VSRALEFANEGGRGSTYLDKEDVASIFDVLKSREAEGDPLLKEGEGSQIYTKLTESFARLTPQV